AKTTAKRPVKAAAKKAAPKKATTTARTRIAAKRPVKAVARKTTTTKAKTTAKRPVKAAAKKAAPKKATTTARTRTAAKRPVKAVARKTTARRVTSKPRAVKTKRMSAEMIRHASMVGVAAGGHIGQGFTRLCRDWAAQIKQSKTLDASGRQYLDMFVRMTTWMDAQESRARKG
ncbi:MAG: hypothetical protein AAGA21_12690, partial [Pseudomonadota bacterium]